MLTLRRTWSRAAVIAGATLALVLYGQTTASARPTAVRDDHDDGTADVPGSGSCCTTYHGSCGSGQVQGEGWDQYRRDTDCDECVLGVGEPDEAMRTLLCSGHSQSNSQPAATV